MEDEMRERLRLLLLEDVECGRRPCLTCPYNYSDDACFEHMSGLIADHLIENGAILPPCKIGDVVYIRNKSWHIEQDGISSYQITNMTITQNKKGVWTKKYRAMYLLNGKTIDSQINFSFDDIGKTVFLTREEAEQKLKESENNGYYGKAGGVD